MILLDGPDAAGKSSFIKKIKDQGYPVIKPYYPQKNQLKYYLLSGPLYQDSWLERYYPSEMVYPRVKSGRPQMENYKQYLIETSLFPFKPLIVYFRPPIEEIIKNIILRGDDYIDISEAELLIDEYDKFMDRSQLDVIKYDYTKDSINQIIQRCKHQEEIKAYHPYPNNLIAGDSITTGNLMIIGEQPSNKSMGDGFIRPFISDTGSSLFLHECLYEAGLHKIGMPYFTSFFKFSSHEDKAVETNALTLAKEIVTLSPRKIICLGNDIYKNVLKSVKHSSLINDNTDVPEIIRLKHPSYIKRFGQKKGYIKKIKEAIK